MKRFHFSPEYHISRVIKGGWQLAGGHGSISEKEAVGDMHAFVQAGITTFDCADIYTGVEEMIGTYLRTFPQEKQQVQIHTKYVPDLDRLPHLQPQDTREIIERSLRRLGVDSLDLVQFHWWDFSVKRYVETALVLSQLQQEGKIRNIGVTNFDVAHLQVLIEAGVKILTNQVQFSVLDQRPCHAMIPFCRENGISLICYGTVAGGFLSERYLGQVEPLGDLENRSLTKYKLIIEEAGGWEKFQHLLSVLHTIAEKYQVDIASVATRFILDEPLVAAATVGARNRDHLAALQKVDSLVLSDADKKSIQGAQRALQPLRGDIYSYERDRSGRHGRIMKYRLNTSS